MQILMSKAGDALVGAKVRAIAPGAEIVTMAARDQFERDGAPFPADQVDPELAWIGLDTMTSGLVGPMRQALLDARSTRWVQVFMAGLDSGVFAPVIQKGITVCKSSAQGPSIAEYVIAHALGYLVPVEAQAAHQREHVWKGTPYREVSRTRWLLVGYGAIGREIAKRIKPFGVDLTVVRRDGEGDEFTDHVARRGDLPAVLPEADVVVLALPLTAETRGMCDAAFFEAMKPGSILINIARGALVDDEALRAGLDRDQPARAVLDVFHTEPLPAESWFWDHPKVRVSAHTSPHGGDTVTRGGEIFLENLKRYMAGEPLAGQAQPFEAGL